MADGCRDVYADRCGTVAYGDTGVPQLGKIWIDDIIVAERRGFILIENGDFEAGFMKGFIAGPKTDSRLPRYSRAGRCRQRRRASYSLYLPDQTYLYQFVDGLTIGKTYVFSFNIGIRITVRSKAGRPLRRCIRLAKSDAWRKSQWNAV